MLATRAQIRTILSSLRYATLSRCIGQRFQVTSAESLSAEVAQLGRTIAPTAVSAHQDLRNLYLQIAKYGLLSLQFDVRPEAFDVQFSRGKRLVRELGFGADSVEGLTGADAEFAMLGEIAEDVTLDRWYLLLYCNQVGRSDQDSNSIQDRMRLTLKIQNSGDLSGLPLPGEFEIVDACCTNTSLAWLAKHFFL